MDKPVTYITRRKNDGFVRTMSMDKVLAESDVRSDEELIVVEGSTLDDVQNILLTLSSHIGRVYVTDTPSKTLNSKQLISGKHVSVEKVADPRTLKQVAEERVKGKKATDAINVRELLEIIDEYERQ